MNRIIKCLALLIVISLGLIQAKPSTTEKTNKNSISQETYNPHNTKHHDFIFKHLTIDDGLPSTVVNDIYQDELGLMWFATNMGLIRYDGYKMETLVDRSNKRGANSLTKTMRLLPSTYYDNSLWVAARGGICRVDLKTEEHHYYFDNDLSRQTTIRSGVIWSLCESKRNGLWIGTYIGIEFLDFKSDEFTHFLGDTCVKVLYEDKQGILWIGTWLHGLIRFDPETGEKTCYLNEPDNPVSLSNNNVESILDTEMEGERVIWVGTRSGLNKFYPEKGIFSRPDPKDKGSVDPRKIYISGLHRTKLSHKNTLWLSGSKLRLFSLDTDSILQIKWSVDDPEGISSNGITTIYEDRSGLIWIGSNNGINVYNPIRKPFNNLKHISKDPSSLSSDIVTAIHQTTRDKLWVGTVNGLNVVDKRSGKVDSLILPDHFIQSIKSDHKGNLWIGCMDDLYELDPISGRIRSYYDNSGSPDVLNNGSVRDIYIDSSDDLFLAVDGGFYHFDCSEDKFIRYLPITRVNSIIPSLRYDNIFWLGGDVFGLVKLDINNGYFVDHSSHVLLSGALSSSQVNCIFRDRANDLWVGTAQGLNKRVSRSIPPDSSKVISYKQHFTNEKTMFRDSCGAYFDENSRDMYYEDSLFAFEYYNNKGKVCNCHIVGILQDEKDNLWLSTLNGLVKFDPISNTSRSYNIEDGLPSNQFYKRACYKNENNELFFGTTKGLTYFNPDSIRDNGHIAPAVLTDFLLFHKPVFTKGLSSNSEDTFHLPASISYLDTLELTYDQNTITLEFASLDYHNSMKNQYAYQLSGIDKDWIFTDASQRTATYTNLDPGKYVFKVKGSNNDGLWNEKERTLNIIIHPPWWKTTLAYIGYVLLGLIGIFLFLYFLLGRIKLQHQMELEHLEAERYHEIDTLKSRFFANISHEFRTPLTLILGPVEKMLNRLKDKESQHDLSLMQRQAKRLLYLVIQLLDLSKLEAGKMSLRTTEQDIIPLIKGIVLSFSSLSDRKKINLTFKSNKQVLAVYIQNDIIVKIITNLLTNAFKFTSAGGEINVNISSDKNKAIILVQDTGVGIPEDKHENIFDRFYQINKDHMRKNEGSGIGLSLIKELVDLHKANISVKSKVNVGTEFKLELPLGRDHLDDNEIVEETLTYEHHYFEPETLVDLKNDLKPEENNISKWESTWEILIVEDNQDVREYIKSYLENDYYCMEADNGKKGFDMAKNKLPDLIISDVMMPQMDGVELTLKLKNDERTSHIPVILLTAKADIEDKLGGLETGADDYLTKPFEARELLVRIRNLIDLRHKLQESFKKEYSILPDNIDLSSMDKKFMHRVIELVKENLKNTDFNIEHLSKHMFMSRQHLNRKLKAITGLTSKEFIRSIQLKTAAFLLRKQEETVTEIAYRVGFSSPSYFSEQFKLHFGCSPSKFAKLNKD